MAQFKQDLRDDIAAAGLIQRIGPDLILPATVAAYQERHAQTSGMDDSPSG